MSAFRPEIRLSTVALCTLLDSRGLERRKSDRPPFAPGRLGVARESGTRRRFARLEPQVKVVRKIWHLSSRIRHLKNRSRLEGLVRFSFARCKATPTKPGSSRSHWILKNLGTDEPSSRCLLATETFVGALDETVCFLCSPVCSFGSGRVGSAALRRTHDGCAGDTGKLLSGERELQDRSQLGRDAHHGQL